jgi:serine/threonine protein kinase
MTTPNHAQPGLFGPGDVLQQRYRIEREIGRGGYSIVYQATDVALGTDVALKVLVPPPAVAHIARERMKREAQSVRGLVHPNVVALHDFLEEGPWTFLVMEHVRGPNLAAHIVDHGPLPVEDVIRLGRDIASALTVAHRHGILHRDVKPQNVLIDTDGTARLTDFGSARMVGCNTVTQTGGIVGTLPYTAPEVFTGHRADARSDVYSLGVTLYFALTGRLPKGPSRNAPPTPSDAGFAPREIRSDAPEWLDAAVARATTRSPAHRFSTAAALETALARDNDDAGLTISHRVESCLVCNGPELFEIGVCPSCATKEIHHNDALIFVGPCSRRERNALESVLASLAPNRASRSSVDDLASGERPLVRVPHEAADRVVHQLGHRAVRARAVAHRATWKNLPLQFYLLLLMIAGVGGWAGLQVMDELLLVSPLVSLLLWMLATRATRVSMIQPSERSSAFPDRLERRLVETFVSTSTPARSLLTDLVKLSRAPYQSAMGTRPDAPFGRQIEELLHCACDAATDLSKLDAQIDVFEDRRDAAGSLSDEWEARLATVERVRDGLVHKFLEAMTTVAHADIAATASDHAAGRLSEVTSDIQEGIRLQNEARREVEMALQS